MLWSFTKILTCLPTTAGRRFLANGTSQTGQSVQNEVNSLPKGNLCALKLQSRDMIPVHAWTSLQFHFQDRKLDRSHARTINFARQRQRSCVLIARRGPPSCTYMRNFVLSEIALLSHDRWPWPNWPYPCHTTGNHGSNWLIPTP